MPSITISLGSRGRCRSRLLAVTASLALATLVSCAEAGSDGDIEPESSPDGDTSATGAPSDGGASAAPSDRADAALTPSAPSPDAAVTPPAPRDGAAATEPTPPFAAPPTNDAGSAAQGDDLDELLDGLTGGATTTGSWKLDDGSPEECPAEPPPLPIIGGPCLGIYFICNWSDPSGATYTCTCDWVHWLCI